MNSEEYIEDWKQKFASLYESYQKLNPEPDFTTFFQKTVVMALDKSDRSRPNELIQHIKSEVLVIRGETAPFVLEEHLFDFAKLVKKVRVVTIPSAGHNTSGEQPEALAKEIASFLA